MAMSSNGNLSAWNPLTQQQVFRQLLHAFSYPGTVATLAAVPDNAFIGVLAALLDSSVTLADPDQLVAPALLPALEVRSSAPELANFVVAGGGKAPGFTPALGTLESPELGATLILKVERIGEGDILHVSGPGCEGETGLPVRGLAAAWLDARSAWNAGFPMGVDLILVDECRIAALPRTTVIAGIAGKGNRTWAM